MIILIVICVIVLPEKFSSGEKYIIIHPNNTTAILGSTITLPCRTKVFDKIDVFWVKDGFGLGNSRDDIRQYGRSINNKIRYDLPFNINEGEYDLRITDLELSDEGCFYCQILVKGIEYYSSKAKVNVRVSCEPPILIQSSNQGAGPKEQKSSSNPIIVNDGEYLIIDCIAKNGRPKATLSWYLNDMFIDKDYSGTIIGTFSGSIETTKQQSTKHERLINSISTLKILINSLIHGNWIKCIAVSPGFENEKLTPALAQIEVHTIPIVKIGAYPTRDGNEYTENDVIEFSCTATGRPNTFSWKWYLNRIHEVNIIVNKYTLRINRSMHKSILKCSAMSTREGSSSIQIFVKYGPRFINENTLLYAASIGETVEMSCETESNPTASVVWQREESHEIITRGTELIRNNIQEEDFGVYRCTAKAAGFSAIFKNSYLAKKKAPIIQQPSVSYGREGQSARLSCSIESVPLPKDNEIKWSFNKRVISASNRHKSYQEAFNGGVVTVLQILSLSNDDFGNYNCSVKTSLGSFSASVILLNKGETPILMIVGASIIFVFILLVTTVVLCICKRKNTKSEYEKGNPSSPEIPGHHNAKSTLIDSDCHCNPNLYSWIPQTLDLKENRGLLNNIQNQDESLLSHGNDMESSYSNSLSGRFRNSKSMQLNNQDNQRSNPLIYNLQSKTLESAHKYSANFPFATLSISPRNVSNGYYDQSQCPSYLYHEFCPNIGSVQVPPGLHGNDIPSPVYLIKNNLNHKQRQFPTDFYPTSATLINTTQNKVANDNSNNTLVSEYARNI